MNLNKMLPINGCADYEDILETVTENIEEKYSNTPHPLIQSITTAVLDNFIRELQAHEGAMNDFQSTPLKDWDRKIIDPLVKLTKKNIDKREETQKTIENLQKRINILSARTQKLRLTEEKNDDSDNDSLHLEE